MFFYGIRVDLPEKNCIFAVNNHQKIIVMATITLKYDARNHIKKLCLIIFSND